MKDGQSFFVKQNSIENKEGMFQAEAAGLERMKNAGAKTPTVIKTYADQGEQYLLLSYHPPEKATANSWNHAGRMLAQMHRQQQDTFGLDHSNYMGSLVQENANSDTFHDFYVNSRILPQLKIARDCGRLSSLHSRKFDQLCLLYESMIPKEKPSLVHGDLWSGNFHSSNDGILLIDPAISFSHREVDLAMTQLFGSQDANFYEAYKESYPLESGLKERVPLFNMYPLLIHLNIFDNSYLIEIDAILKSYCA
jgi:fructosamine-3-kinase